MLKIEDLPPLPAGWTWHFDEDGEPFADCETPDGGRISVYQWSVGKYTGEVAIATRNGKYRRPFTAAPIAVFVAVDKAARLSHGVDAPESKDT